MLNASMAGLLKIHRHRPPLFWQRWSIDPYFDARHPIRVTRRQENDLPASLDRLLQLRRNKYPDPALIGLGCEPYPVREKRSRVTHRCLEVLAKHGCPVMLMTESPMILRDIDLIRELHEDSMATIGLRIPIDLFQKGGSHSSSLSASEAIALMERVCRSSVQTGLIVESVQGAGLWRRKLRRFFKLAQELNLDFIHIPDLRKYGSGGLAADKSHVDLRVKKSVLHLASEFNIRLTPRRYLPQDRRRENQWLAETLANHAYFLELSGRNSASHWAAARRIDNFESDIRLWALRGELATMSSTNPSVRLDVERFLRGERNIHLSELMI